MLSLLLVCGWSARVTTICLFPPKSPESHLWPWSRDAALYVLIKAASGMPLRLEQAPIVPVLYLYSTPISMRMLHILFEASFPASALSKHVRCQIVQQNHQTRQNRLIKAIGCWGLKVVRNLVGMYTLAVAQRFLPFFGAI